MIFKLCHFQKTFLEEVIQTQFKDTQGTRNIHCE